MTFALMLTLGIGNGLDSGIQKFFGQLLEGVPRTTLATKKVSSKHCEDLLWKLGDFKECGRLTKCHWKRGACDSVF